MEEKTMQVMKGVKPNVVNWIGALIGAALAWWTGLPPLAQALLIVQGADILTGLLCAVTGKSRKTESGKVSSGALLMGVMKKGLEWLVVGVCVSVGNGLGVTSVCGAAMTYMIATELVSLIENLEIFGLNVPLLGKLLDVAQGDGEEGRAQGRQLGACGNDSFSHGCAVPTFDVFHRLNPPQAATMKNVPQGGKLLPSRLCCANLRRFPSSESATGGDDEKRPSKREV